MTTVKYDVIIVGAGAAGTALAALLSNCGLKTLLLEKKSHVGGRASTYQLPNGILIDSGVHGIPYYDLGTLRTIEESLEIHLELVDYSPLLAFYDVEEEICVEVSNFSNEGLQEVDRIWGQGGRLIQLLNFLRTASEEIAENLDNISVKEYFGRLSPSLQFQQLLTAINGMITITPELGSAGEFVRSFSRLFSSQRPITYPKSGGIQRLSETMAELCKSNGGQVVTLARVTELIIQDRHIEGVRAEIRSDTGLSIEEIFSAPIVVVTIPLQFLFEIASEEYFSIDFINSIKNLQGKQSCAQGIGFTFKKELLAQFPWNPKCWGAILFFQGKKPRYLSVPSALLEGLAPPGIQYLFYGVVSTPEEVADKRGTKALLKELILELNHLFPNLKDYKEFQFSGSSEMVLGTAKRVGMTGAFKPPNICAEIEGLFFAGDTVAGNGPGLECTWDSAYKCAKAVQVWLKKRKKIE